MKEPSTSRWAFLPETPEKEYARKRVALGVGGGMQGVRCGSQGLGSQDGEEGWEEEVLEKMDGGGRGQDGGAGQGAGRGGKGSRVGAEHTFWEVGEVSAVHCGGRNCLPASVSSFPLTASCSV